MGEASRLEDEVEKLSKDIEAKQNRNSRLETLNADKDMKIADMVKRIAELEQAVKAPKDVSHCGTQTD